MLTLLSACQCGEPTTPQDAATRDALVLEDASGASDAWQRADIGLSRPDVPTIEEPCRSQSRILPTSTLPSDWAADSVGVVGDGDSLLLVRRMEATLLNLDALGESLPEAESIGTDSDGSVVLTSREAGAWHVLARSGPTFEVWRRDDETAVWVRVSDFSPPIDGRSIVMRSATDTGFWLWLRTTTAPASHSLLHVPWTGAARVWELPELGSDATFFRARGTRDAERVIFGVHRGAPGIVQGDASIDVGLLVDAEEPFIEWLPAHPTYLFATFPTEGLVEMDQVHFAGSVTPHGDGEGGLRYSVVPVGSTTTLPMEQSVWPSALPLVRVSGGILVPFEVNHQNGPGGVRWALATVDGLQGGRDSLGSPGATTHVWGSEDGERAYLASLSSNTLRVTEVVCP